MRQAGEQSIASLWYEDCSYCRKFAGSESELVSVGLAEPDWFPGRPGRNVVRQTIFFEADGRLTFRKVGGGGTTSHEARGRHWMTIIRASKNRYVVERAYLPSERLREKLADDEFQLRQSMHEDSKVLGIDWRSHDKLISASFRAMREAIGVPAAPSNS